MVVLVIVVVFVVVVGLVVGVAVVIILCHKNLTLKFGPNWVNNKQFLLLLLLSMLATDT